MYTDEKISQALQEAKGNISVAAKTLGFSHSTIYRRIKANKELQEILDNERKSFIDFAESKLQELIGDGNLTSCILFLKTQVRHRGYGDSWVRGPFDPTPGPYEDDSETIVTMKLGDKVIGDAQMGAMLLDIWGGDLGAVPPGDRERYFYPPFDSLPFTDDDNGNGRITCAEARRHGIAPVRLGHPAYPYMRDGDGVVCE